jgi:DNA-binding transcriptional LysR family regulator
MIANIEALSALSELGTMTKSATRLRITQSAVSKRIAALEVSIGHRLIEHVGRGVRLTPAGVTLLEKTDPFMTALRDALRDDRPAGNERLEIGVSESILASWGSEILADIRKANPRLALVVNAHRSPVALDHVRSGEYVLALCAGLAEDTPELRSEVIYEEPMVIVPRGLDPLVLSGTVPVMTIEPHSATWQCIGRRMRVASRSWPFRIEVTQTLQSFSCIAQMARCGLAHGLVPLGIVNALGIPESTVLALPDRGLTRPVSLVGRRSAFARPAVESFHESLIHAVTTITERTASFNDSYLASR